MQVQGRGLKKLPQPPWVRGKVRLGLWAESPLSKPSLGWKVPPGPGEGSPL